MPPIERADAGEPEIQSRGLYGRLRRLDRCLCRQIRLDVVVELALRDRARLGERPIARDIALGLSELGLRLRKLRFRLRERCLEGTRIDLEQHITFAHTCAFAVRARNEIAAHLRANFGIDEPVECGNPLARDLDRLWRQVDHGHRQRARRRRLGAGAAAGGQERRDCDRNQQDDHRPWSAAMVRHILSSSSSRHPTRECIRRSPC